MRDQEETFSRKSCEDGDDGDDADDEDKELVFNPDDREDIELPGQSDYWTMPNYDRLIRWHVNPRTELFIPTEDHCPIPLEWLDTMRDTYTDLGHGDLRQIEDYWTEDRREGGRHLDEEWIGRTVFSIKRPKTDNHYELSLIHI